MAQDQDQRFSAGLHHYQNPAREMSRYQNPTPDLDYYQPPTAQAYGHQHTMAQMPAFFQHANNGASINFHSSVNANPASAVQPEPNQQPTAKSDEKRYCSRHKGLASVTDFRGNQKTCKKCRDEEKDRKAKNRKEGRCSRGCRAPGHTALDCKACKDQQDAWRVNQANTAANQ